MSEVVSPSCALCGRSEPLAALSEAAWLPGEAIERIAADHPGWRRADGACPACVQQTLLEMLLDRGENAFHVSVQRAWPLDAEAAFGALPSPLRLHADPRFSGRGVTVAILDSGFCPHPDLILPQNRIRVWADASKPDIEVRRFSSTDTPGWPGSEAAHDSQWHGLMTSAVAAGNGHLSHGLYRGLAPEAELVLVQVRDKVGRITNDTIERALRWVGDQLPAVDVRVVSLSVAGEAVDPLAGNPVDRAVEGLVEKGVCVIAAAGNDGVRRLVPPSTSPDALTVGGLDDRNTLDHEERALWHSNYGRAATGALKPDLVAPSLWVVAPILPGTELAREAAQLFERRAEGSAPIEQRIAAAKLITPHYQHVEGTSFAAPLVAGAVACMLEASASLTPLDVRRLLSESSHRVSGAPVERQGAGVIDVGRAVSAALASALGKGSISSPDVLEAEVVFRLSDRNARYVRLSGTWDNWVERTLMTSDGDGVFGARLPTPAIGRHAYKFLLGEGLDEHWMADPMNPARMHDGYGGYNSVLEILPPKATMTSGESDPESHSPG